MSNHDNYLQAGLNPTFEGPKESIPGIYEKYVPPPKDSLNLPSDVFEETVDEAGNYDSNVIREYSLKEIFENQFNIFR